MMVEFLFEESFNNRPLLGKNDGSFFFPPQKILQLLNYNLALLCPEPTLTPFAFRGFGTPASSFPLEFRVPKRRNLFTLNRFGVSYTGISRLAETRDLALWFPGCRNAENLFHAKPIRGFVYQDFMTCGDKGSFPLVSRVPKRRKPFSR
jgi:hypothetical protein